MLTSDSEADVRFEVPEDAPDPVSGREMVPDWYRMLPAFLNQTNTEASVKMCRPFGDSMRLGTLVRAPVDIHLNKTADGIEIVNDELAEYLTVYDTDQPPIEGNSKFHLPEAKFELPLYWETEPDALTFITEPKNRNFPEFRPFSLLVDAGQQSKQVILPVTFETDKVRIEEGTPLAQFWFLDRQKLITEMEPASFEDYPDVKEVHQELSRLHQRKKDMYRAHFWEAKDFPTYEKTTASESALATSVTTDEPSIDDIKDDIDHENNPLHFFAFEQNYGLVPDPVPNEEYIPDHYQHLNDFIDDDEHGEMLQTQITNAMKLGWIVPLSCDMHVSQTENGVNVESSFDQSAMHEMMANKMRGNPLGQTEPINIHARWMAHSADGYSNYFIRPQNHFQKHYRAYNGIVEDDEWIDNANAPGMLKAPTSGVTFKRGMPVIEIIPFHRDDFGRNIEVVNLE